MRALHSFPTRRSSDLVFLRHVAADDLALELVTGSRLLRLEHQLDLGVLAGAAGLLLVRVVLGHRADRKSTRLNSSHVEISYAVFCLKKKTRQMCADVH